jgi:SAM-dependent methyltransferase
MKLKSEIVTPYKVFSTVYDKIMGHVDYERWAKFILNNLPDSKENLATLDIACGTAALFLFYPEYYQKTGIDNSFEMLKVARRNNPEDLFIETSMIDFRINRKFDFITCNHDSINYLLDKKSILSHLQTVKSHLKPEGLYFFDISSEENLIQNFHNKIFRDTIDETFIIWENQYDSARKEILSKLFFTINSESGTEEFKEFHIQKFHTTEDIKSLVELSGLKLVNIGTDYRTWKIKKNSSLINFLVQN